MSFHVNDSYTKPETYLPGFGQLVNPLENDINKNSTFQKIINYLGDLSYEKAPFVFDLLQKCSLKLHQWSLKSERLLPPDAFPKNYPEDTPYLGQSTKVNLRLAQHVTESFEWKKQLIQSAEKSIELSPNFASGECFREVLKLIQIQMKLKPELKVHLICSGDLLEKEDLKLISKLAKNPRFKHLITKKEVCSSFKGIHSEENHVKLLIVDEKYFVTGSSGIVPKMVREESPPPLFKEKFNIKDQLLAPGFRELDIVGEGVLATRMRVEFFKLFSIWKQRTEGEVCNEYFPLNGIKGNCPLFHEKEGLFENVKMKFLVSGPEHKHNFITEAFESLIFKAKEEIQMANLLFYPNKKIIKALKIKKEEGARITGIFNGRIQKKFQIRDLFDGFVRNLILIWPNRNNYHLFNTVYEYKKNACLHKKTMVVDKKHTVIGTYNLGTKSDKFDYEMIVIIKNKKVAEEILKGFDVDKNNSNVITYPEIGKISRRWKYLSKLFVLSGNFF